MSDFGAGAVGQRYAEGGAVTASTLLTTITASNTAHVKGSYTELISSTAFDAIGLLITTESFDVSLAYLLDLAIGGAGSEVVLVADIPMVPRISQQPGNPFFLPVRVPAGSRLAARCQCSAAGGGRLRAQVAIVSGDLGAPMAAGRTATYGAVSATSLGTAIDAGASANTKGAWVEMSAALPAAIRWAVLCCVPAIGAGGAATFLIDLGVGAGGSEAVLVPNLFAQLFIAGTASYPAAWLVPCTIAAGERVALRAQSSTNTAADRVLHAVLIGAD